MVSREDRTPVQRMGRCGTRCNLYTWPSACHLRVRTGASGETAADRAFVSRPVAEPGALGQTTWHMTMLPPPSFRGRLAWLPVSARQFARSVPRILGAAVVLLLLAADAPSAHAQDLNRAGHDLGSPDAPVEVIEFHDLGCSQCARFTAQSFPAIEREFIRTGKVRWKFVPFALGSFRHSAFAAEAAECAAEQGKFAPVHKALLQEQGRWKASLSVPHDLFTRVAQSAGVDTVRFRDCVTSERTRDRVREHKAISRVLQVYGTPTFLVQREKRILGAIPQEQFAAFLREEVKAAQLRAARARLARPPAP